MPEPLPLANECATRSRSRPDERRRVDLACTWVSKIAPSAAMPGRDPDLPERVVDPGGHAGALAATVETAVEASGALTMPMPMPPTRKPGSSTVQCESTVTRLISEHRERVRARGPAPSRARIGTRAESRPASGATKNERG